MGEAEEKTKKRTNLELALRVNGDSTTSAGFTLFRKSPDGRLAEVTLGRNGES